MKEEIDFENLDEKELQKKLEQLIEQKKYESSALQKILKGLDNHNDIDPEIKEKIKTNKKNKK